MNYPMVEKCFCLPCQPPGRVGRCPTSNRRLVMKSTTKMTLHWRLMRVRFSSCYTHTDTDNTADTHCEKGKKLDWKTNGKLVKSETEPLNKEKCDQSLFFRLNSGMSFTSRAHPDKNNCPQRCGNGNCIRAIRRGARARVRPC